MVRKFAAVIAALLLIPAVATGGMEWKDETPALKVLKTYTDNINKLLTETGEHPINSFLMCLALRRQWRYGRKCRGRGMWMKTSSR